MAVSNLITSLRLCLCAVSARAVTVIHNMFPLSDEEARTPDVTSQLRQIREAQSKAKEALWISKERLIPVNFEEGEQVWLKGHNLKTHHPTAKLAP